jgi:glycosyltransferase involved in cell wall biosynthesis/uncharacterized membrane protein YbhN (UPF0104 family)
MRIAVLHLGFFYAGGGERLVLEEVRGLRRLGHEVECFAPVVDEDACYPELIREVGVRSLLPGPPRWLPARVALWVLICSLLAPVLALRLRGFDVVFAANQPALWFGWVARKLFGVPYVAYLAQPNRVLHPRKVDLETRRPNLDYRIFALVSVLARPLVYWADRASVEGADEMLVNGTYMSEVLQKVYGRPMISCPAGAHPAPESELDYQRRLAGLVKVGRTAIQKPYVLLTNRHYPQKRFDYAVRTLAELPDIRLVITGAATAYTAEIERLACELGVRERLILTGLVSESQLTKLYAEAAVYVYPAPEEDYGMGIVEAMGHGVPVVAWKAAGPTSTVVDGENGLLAEPFDEERFSALVGRLLDDRRLAAAMGRRGWRSVNDGLGYDSHIANLETRLRAAADAAQPRGSAGRVLKPALQTLAGLVLLVVWARTMNLGQVWQQARPHHPAVLLAILALGVAAGLVRALRWSILLRPLARVGVLHTLWINSAGALLNYAIPLRTGDAARVWWVNRRHQVPMGSGLATILVDKTFDLGAVVLVLCTATVIAWWRSQLSPAALGGLSALALGASGLLAAVVGVAWAGPRLTRSRLAARLLPERWSAAAAAQSFSFRAGAQVAWSAPRALGLALLSALALGLDALAFSVLFAALDLPVAFPTALAAYAALLLTFTLPAAPGYVGSLEVAGSLVLGAGLGLGAAAAGGAVLLWHALNACLVLGLGLIGLQRVSRSRAEVGGRPAKVAVFHCGFTYSGGGERIVIEEVLGLRRRGYEVSCYAPTVEVDACYPDLIREVGVHTLVPQLPRWVPLRDAFHMLAASALVPLYAWRFSGFDMLVGCNQPGAWIAWLASRLLRKRCVVYLNQPNRLVYPRPIDLATGWQTKRDYELLNVLIQRVRGFVAWADRASIRGADELLVNGDYIGDIIRSVYGRDARDCPAGCHADGEPTGARRFRGGFELNGLRVRKPFVLLTNRHYPQKRFDLAIRAMRQVCDRHPSVQLVIPGPATSHTPELRRLAAELGLEENVLFTGAISEAELQRLYAEAAVYVYPAPEEDFGMGVIESMAKGIPVVAWNQAGPTVTVAHGETGYLARPGDVTDYATGISSYLDDPELNAETGRRARARAMRFDWERHIDVLESALTVTAEAPQRVPASQPAAQLAPTQAG